MKKGNEGIGRRNRESQAGQNSPRGGEHFSQQKRQRDSMSEDTKASKRTVVHVTEEVASLDRIQWRLVNTPDGVDLERVLSKLVPIMVKKMDMACGMDPLEGRKVQQKVLEILSHVNVRLKGSLETRLPVEAIWDAYCACESAVACNIGMVYLGKAFERASREEMWKMVGKIVQGIHSRLEVHRSMLAMYACRSLQGLNQKVLVEGGLGMDVCSVFKDPRDLDVFLYYAVRIALYVRQGGLVRQTLEGDRPRAVPGLCHVDLKLIESSKVSEHIEACVQGALELVAKAEIEPKKAMMFLLAAASSPYEDVRALGERVLMKTCVFDTARPTVDVEDVDVIQPLFDMYLGTMEDSMIPEEHRRQPASKVLRGKIVGILCKSVCACNINPQSIMVIHDCVFGESAGLYTQQQGMQFAVHILRHAESLEHIAPAIIRHSLRVLETSEGNANMNALRGFAYQCLGQIAQRDPETLQDQALDLMRACFDALQKEPPGVRASVQEAVNCLSNCFKRQTSEEGRIRVGELVEGYTKSDNGSVRQAALQWMIWIFDFSDSFARYTCISMTSDVNMNISDLALEGLDMDKVVSYQKAKFQQDVDACMPNINDMLETIFKKNSKILKVSDVILPSKSMESMLNFLDTLQIEHTEVLEKYFGLLSSCLIPRAPGSLHKLALDSLLKLSAMYPEEFLGYFVTKCHMFESMLCHVDEDVAIKSARVLGFVSQHLSAEKLESLVSRMNEKLCEVMEKPKKQEDALGYLYASGFIQAWQDSADSLSVSQKLFTLATDKEYKDEMIQSTALLCVGYASFGLPLENQQITTVLQDTVTLLKKSPHKAVLPRVVVALGLLAMTTDQKDHEESITDEILGNHCSKDDLLLEDCGKALVCIWGGSGMSKQQFLLLHQGLENLPFSCRGTSQNRNRILKFIVNKCMSSTRAEARMAGAMWLLDLITNVANTPEISDNIPDIQKAFCMLLGDNNDRTQELASRGVTASYEHAKDGVKNDLVDALVTILSGNATRTWMRPNDVDQDTQLFEPGSLGSLPEQGGNISTYKEICSLATDLGQPDLIYQFMNLAAHQAAADASRGAAYGMASVASIAGDALKPHVKALIPRLYRSTFDPNVLVRDSMRHIWTILVDDQREVLHEHASDIVKLLNKDMTRQQWRVRESAALAMSDILQSIDWVDMKDMFETILVCCFRVMDDVKESVALAGQSLSRSIMSLSVRLTDPQSNKSKDSKEFLSVLFPVLMNQGMNSNVSSIKAFSIRMVAKLIKSAGKDTVQDSMELIVPPLLEALSGMEDSRLNYLEQHVQRLGMDGNKFEEERIRFSQSSPVAETLDICSKYIDGAKFCDMSSIFSSFIRRAVGSTTKAGAANFIISSVRRLGSDVSPVAFSLMKVLYEASSLENSASVKKTYSVAYANLSKYAPVRKFDPVVDGWLQSCRHEDASKETMLLSGLMLRSLSLDASDVFLRYADDIAPVAFLLGYEADESVSTLWRHVWDEVTTATGSGIRAHVIPATNITLEALSSSHWGRKKAAGEGIIYLCENAGDLLGTKAGTIVSDLLGALPGRLWDGKEILLRSLTSVILALDKPQMQKLASGESAIIDALLSACQKQKLVYKTEAFVQLAKVVRHMQHIDFYKAIWPVLKESIALQGEKLQGTQSAEGTTDAKPVSLPDLAILLGCVSALWLDTAESIKNRDASYVEDTCTALLPILQYSSRPADSKAVLQAYQAIVSCIDASSMSRSTAGNVSHHTISKLSFSKVEDVRMCSINLLNAMGNKGLLESLSKDIATRLKPVLESDKSEAVRGRIRETLSLVE